jgi:prophage antirepressor-like protein
MNEKIMSNPKNFCLIANSKGVFYEHLLEGKKCLGSTNLGRMFDGNSNRGGIHSSSIDCWIETFEYLITNPDHIDDEIPKPFNMTPKNEYFDFVEKIKIEIPETELERWKNLSKNKLSEEAQKYHIVRGIKNKKALNNLLNKMIEMYERRKTNIWSKNFIKNENNSIDYNMKNINDLREICKEKNLPNAHLKLKDDIVKLLQNNPHHTIYNEMNKDYNEMTSLQLKNLAKKRCLTEYNNLKKDELVKLHQDFDEDIEFIETKNDYSVFKFDGKEIRTIGDDNPLFVVKDIAEILDLSNYKYVFNRMDDYMKIEGYVFIDSLGRKHEIQVINEAGLYSMILRSNKPNAKLFQRYVFEEVLPTIRKTGSFTIENKFKFMLENNRPLSQVINLSNYDKEALEIEKSFNFCANTNCPLIYIAYIGNGLLKIGFTDCKFKERLSKHLSTESEYQQFLVLTCYEVSGKNMEETLHNFLDKYRYSFKNQKEIYKPSSTIADFVLDIQQFLEENDFKLKCSKLEKEIYNLKEENLKLQCELLKKENEILKSK